MKNSRHFAEMMKLLENESMVSFDVKSLFANVQVDEALEVVHKGLVEDDTLIDRTSPKLSYPPAGAVSTDHRFQVPGILL